MPEGDPPLPHIMIDMFNIECSRKTDTTGRVRMADADGPCGFAALVLDVRIYDMAGAHLISSAAGDVRKDEAIARFYDPNGDAFLSRSYES